MKVRVEGQSQASVQILGDLVERTDISLVFEYVALLSAVSLFYLTSIWCHFLSARLLGDGPQARLSSVVK